MSESVGEGFDPPAANTPRRAILSRRAAGVDALRTLVVIVTLLGSLYDSLTLAQDDAPLER